MVHGHFDPATGEGMLAFEGTGGRLDLLSGRAFATKVKDLRTLGVVVLNACATARTGRRSQVNPFHGVVSRQASPGVAPSRPRGTNLAARSALSFTYRRIYEEKSKASQALQGDTPQTGIEYPARGCRRGQYPSWSRLHRRLPQHPRHVYDVLLLRNRRRV
jgi:hypothetical protein